MSDMRADDPAFAGQDDRLPWLEAVEEEDYRDGPSAGKMIALVLVGLAAIGFIVGGLFWMGTSRTASDGEPQLIAAPAGDYKVRPDDPGGMRVEGAGDTAFAASEGADPSGAINAGALPETPLARTTPAPREQSPAPAPAAASAASTVAAPAPAAAGVTIQLGAFSSQAAANAAWKAMAGRFSYLAPLSHSVTPVSNGGKTLYRLRASGLEAAGICNRLRIAGEQCVTV